MVNTLYINLSNIPLFSLMLSPIFSWFSNFWNFPGRSKGHGFLLRIFLMCSQVSAFSAVLVITLPTEAILPLLLFSSPVLSVLLALFFCCLFLLCNFSEISVWNREKQIKTTKFHRSQKLFFVLGFFFLFVCLFVLAEKCWLRLSRPSRVPQSFQFCKVHDLKMCCECYVPSLYTSFIFITRSDFSAAKSC